jgi:hypothetical protein
MLRDGHQGNDQDNRDQIEKGRAQADSHPANKLKKSHVRTAREKLLPKTSPD